ncbi:MAG TPA: helix-turn-helix domain-containing protein [Capillimicrobium sp.]|nr:helix-turn-helix domain-containing protein [Capillimicrobium sp.]
MAPSRRSEATRALYVRIPLSAAERLDRAAEARGASKRDLIAGLLAEHLDEVAAGDRAAPARPITVGGDELAVGHHAFRAAPAPDVLTLEEAAELLRVTPEALAARAEAGEVPGRRIGDEWRFRREALLAWLGPLS